MFGMRTLSMLLVMATSAFVSGCLWDTGRVYEKPIGDIHVLLKDADLPPFVFGSDNPEFDLDASETSKVVWIVKNQDREMLRMVADLAPVDATSTRVRVTAVGATEGPFGNVADRLAKNPTLTQMYVVAMEEKVAAVLEARPFDMSKVYGAIGAAGAANVHNIHKSALRAIEADSKRTRSNIDKAYADEAERR